MLEHQPDARLPLPQILRPRQRRQPQLAQSNERSALNRDRIRVADVARFEHERAETALMAGTNRLLAVIPGDFGVIRDLRCKVPFEIREPNRSGQEDSGLALCCVEFRGYDELGFGEGLRLRKPRAPAVGQQISSIAAARAAYSVRICQTDQHSGPFVRIRRLLCAPAQLASPVRRAACGLKQSARVDAQAGRQRACERFLVMRRRVGVNPHRVCPVRLAVRRVHSRWRQDRRPIAALPTRVP